MKKCVSICFLGIFLFLGTSAPAEEIKFIQNSPVIAKEPINGEITGPKLPENKKEVDKNAGAAQDTNLPESPEILSEFEAYVSKKTPPEIYSGIRQFGHSLFKSPTTYAPLENVPVSPDYVIGPGDELKINVWGEFEAAWECTVDRDGMVMIPKVGPLGVAQLTFKELKDLIRMELDRFYRGYELDVQLAKLKEIKIYVVGNAKNPGTYSVSSLSTLVNGLFLAGGPGKSGTMRDIQLIRGGEAVTRLDLYDFLLKGDKRKDARLQPEDVIFIPPIKGQAAIAGSVNNPAIYEVSDGLSLEELIGMAGGLSAVAFGNRLQIERIDENFNRIALEYTLAEVKEKKVPVRSGDIITFFPVVEDWKTVKVLGPVHREGEYAYKEGMTIKDLVFLAGGLKYHAYTTEAELTRTHLNSEGILVEGRKVLLADILEGRAEDISLQPYDYLLVKTLPEWAPYESVTVSGEVRFPGTYVIKKGETLSSLIERAGGFTKDAYMEGAVFLRERERELQQQRIDEMLDKLEADVMGSSTSEMAVASSADEARILQMETEQRKKFIATLRKVKAQGRITTKILDPADLKGTRYDIELEDGDSITIPEDPRTVQVIGAVQNQNTFLFEKGKNADFYINSSGGLRKSADKENVYIIKANGLAVRDQGNLFSWNKNIFRWSRSAKVDSGDVIVVPEKLERTPWLRNTKDITQILFHLATTAGVLLVAF